MIHPMWSEFAKVALDRYLENEDSETLDDDAFKRWAAEVADESAVVADAMCAEYDKRNGASDARVVLIERLRKKVHGVYDALLKRIG